MVERWEGLEVFDERIERDRQDFKMQQRAKLQDLESSKTRTASEALARLRD